MRIHLGRALCASTALATGLVLAMSAAAQSTGTAVVEELVVTGSTGPRSLDGAIVAVEEPKSRATITAEFISKQQPGASVLETINGLPGVNFTNNDAYGSAGGDLTIRGFDSQRISLLEDGVPLNDSGNYAIFSNQQLDPELIAKVDVNLGTTDVDSPTAAASGGTVNYVSKIPQNEMGFRGGSVSARTTGSVTTARSRPAGSARGAPRPGSAAPTPRTISSRRNTRRSTLPARSRRSSSTPASTRTSVIAATSSASSPTTTRTATTSSAASTWVSSSARA
jgi:iron complex outermembrane receptor protein